MSIRHISMGMICSKQYKSGKKVKEKKTHDNTTSSILKMVSTKPIQSNSTKINQPMAETPYIIILQ